MKQQARLQLLGSMIRAARKGRGLTQQQLAERAGFDTTYISMLESGRRNPPFLTLCQIAKGLEVRLSQLLDGYQE